MNAIAAPWADAALAAALFAVDPAGTGGVVVRAPAGPVRDTWLTLLRATLPPATPVQRVPLHVADDRLLGGLDLAATLAAGRPVAQRGILAGADGGVLVLPMAERMTTAEAARFTTALDAGEIVLEREGFAARCASRFGVVALDEGADADEALPRALADRLAFHLDLSALPPRAATADAVVAEAAIAAARRRLPDVVASPDAVAALCMGASALGIASLRAPLLALRVACASAALAGRDEVEGPDVEVAARLVLAPRATVLPAPPDAEDAEPPPPEQRDDDSPDTPDNPARNEGPLEDLVVAAAVAALPPALLAQLQEAAGARRSAPAAGRAGDPREHGQRGRPLSARRGDPTRGARLNVIATLRAAAPWQPLRRREARTGAPAPTIAVRRDDFHVTRYRQHARTTTVFAVDASGSTALHRLSEAKGAVEFLLAECYVRRDEVALLAFRGRGAELLLPPTRALARAKRALAALPGGGGTPLAAGIAAALDVALHTRRRGATPTVVVLTDGRANVARDGTGGRERALAEALQAARGVLAEGVRALVVDTSPQPVAQARELAQAMGARYIALPHAGAAAISSAVRAATAPSPVRGAR